MYAKTFTGKDTGNPGKPSRMALGSLIIKTKLSLSYEETRQQIYPQGTGWKTPIFNGLLGYHTIPMNRPLMPVRWYRSKNALLQK